MLKILDQFGCLIQILLSVVGGWLVSFFLPTWAAFLLAIPLGYVLTAFFMYLVSIIESKSN